MLFEFNFYSSLLLITFSQGILYSFLLAKKGVNQKDKSNYWLSAFIFCCSLYIAPWMLGFAGWYDSEYYRDILFYIPFQQLFLLGPLIYFYTQSLLYSEFRLSRKDFRHFLIPFIYILSSVGIWFYDHFIYNGYYFYADGSDKDFDDWYQYGGFLSMAFYLIQSLRIYNRYRNKIFQETSYAEVILFRWIKIYLFSFLILMMLPVLFRLIAYKYSAISTYEGSWWYFLLYSVIMCYVAITAYTNTVTQNLKLKSSGDGDFLHPVDELTPDYTSIVEVQEYTETTLLPELDFWKQKIISILTDESIFRNPELTLVNFSEKLQANTSLISKVINQGFGLNFNDFINKYRVDAVCDCLDKDMQQHMTILGIALECGFNSKATFNRAFKKHVGKTPREYMAEINRN